jgi:hypothetical protein
VTFPLISSSARSAECVTNNNRRLYFQTSALFELRRYPSALRHERRTFSGLIVKIVIADDLPQSALQLLKAEGWDVDARTGRAPDQLAQDLADADALVVRSATKVTAELITAARRFA